MATKAQIQKQNERIGTARERILVVLKAHDGFFPFTSELASCVGVRRTYACIARDQLKAEGMIRHGRDSVKVNGRKVPCSFYELTDQQPGPITRNAILRSHLSSQTVNEHGSDSHPWRNDTLVCIACARVRDSLPEWGIVSGDNAGKHSQRHPPSVGRQQIPLTRKPRMAR